MAEHGRHGERHEQRRGQRHDIGEAQRFEQPPLDAAQEEDGQEHQRNDERGEDDGFLDLNAGVEDDLHRLLALVLRVQAVDAQPAKDIFHENHRVVHERADGDGHAAQGHGVDGRAEGFHHQNRHHQRERNGREGDERGADVGQKEQHDEHDQQAAVAQGGLHVVDGNLDEVRLPEDAFINHHARQAVSRRCRRARRRVPWSA